MRTSDDALAAQTLDECHSNELSDEQRQFAGVFGQLLAEKWKRTVEGQQANAQQQQKSDESS